MAVKRLAAIFRNFSRQDLDFKSSRIFSSIGDFPTPNSFIVVRVNLRVNGGIRLSLNTESSTYRLSEETHVNPSVRTDFIRLGSVTTNRKNGLTREQLAVLTGSRSVSTGQWKVFRTYGRVSRGLFPRIRRYGLLYLRTVEYDRFPVMDILKWYR